MTWLPKPLRDQLPRAAALVVAARSRDGRKAAISVEALLDDMDMRELRDLAVLLASFTDAASLLAESLGAPIEPIEASMEGSARRFEVSVSDIVGQSRRQEVVEARQVAAYIAHKLFGVPSTQVGRAFNRDHSTVLHACGRVGETPRLRRISLDIAQRIGWQRPQDGDSTDVVAAV